MSTQSTLVIVPGWRNSGPAHWQTLWANRLPHVVRVELQEKDWLHPRRDVWLKAISETIQSQRGPVVLAAHSLGCIATVHLPAVVTRQIRGALLVAPADPERRGVLADFAPAPHQALPYRSVLVASANDPYCPIRTAGAYARAWGGELVRLQNAGHINADSGHGEWPLGLSLLQSLLADHAWDSSPHIQAEAA